MARALILCAALLLGAQPAAAQVSLLGARNALIQFALSQISTPDGFAITADSIEDAEDGATELVGVQVSDADGVWLTAEAIGLNWSARRILIGELAINNLSARGVRVLRAPVSPPPTDEEAEPEEDDGAGFSWPRAPIATRIDALSLTDVAIAPGVIAQQGLSFDATGAAVDEGDIQSARLQVARIDDTAGQIDLDYTRDFEANTLALTLRADEAAGGLIAELAGFPDDSATRATVDAEGPLTDWRLAFEAETDDVFAAGGNATVTLTQPLAVTVLAAVRPGTAAPPAVRTALGDAATLQVDAREDGAGVIRIDAGWLEAQALQAQVAGSLARDFSASDLTLALSADAPLAALVDGVTFDTLALDAAVSGPLAALDVTGQARLAGLRTAPADVGSATLALDAALRDGAVVATLTGDAAGLRLDRLDPETLGEARLRIEGRYADNAATLTALTLRSPLLEADLSGDADLADGPLALDYRLSAPRLGPIAAAYAVDAAGALEAQGRVAGSLAAPEIAGDVSLTDLAFQDEALGAVTLTHDATLGETLTAEAALRAEGSRFGLARIDAALTLADDTLTLQRFDALALGVAADGSLTLDLARTLADGAFEAEIVDLAPAARLLGGAVTGEGRVTVALSAVDGAQNAQIVGALRDLSAPDARLDTLTLDVTARDLLGAAPAASGALTLAGLDAFGAAAAQVDVTGDGALDGALTLSATARDVAYAPLDARLGALEVQADGADLLDDAASLRATVQASDLAAMGATLAGLTAQGDGRLDGAATAQLTLNDAAYPALEAALETLTLDIAATDLAGAPAVSAQGAAQGLAAAGFSLAALTVEADGADLLENPGGSVALSGEDLTGPDLSVATLSATAAGGALTTAPAGEAQVTLSDVQAAGARTASVAAQAALTQEAEGATATLNAEVAPISAPDAQLGAVTLTARAQDALGTDPRIEADLRAGAGAAGPLTLSRLETALRGPLSDLAVTAALRGGLERQGEPEALSLDAAATVRGLDQPPGATISRLDAALGDAAARLRAPLALSFGETLTAEGLDIALPGGGLRGDAASGPTGLQADITLAIDDLAPLATLADAPIEGGALRLDAEIDTAAQRARAALDVRDLDIVGVDPEVGLPSLDADANWNGSRGALDATIVGDFGQPMRLTAAMPLRAAPGGLPQPPPGAPIDARLQWAGRIGALWAAVPAPDHILDGDVEIDLRVTGPLETPDIAGVAQLRNGSYQNLETGTIMTDITADTRAAGASALSLRMTANDGADGPVALDATLDDGRITATLTTRNAVLVRREDATVALTTDIAVDGPLANPAVTGTVLIDRAEIRLVSAGAPSLPDLGEIRIKGEAPPPPPGPPPQIAPLDLTISAPRNVFVRGRGLDSEWMVDLAVGGFATAPAITGVIERIRGQLTLAGRRLDMERGEIRFFGRTPPDPRLDVALLRESDGVTGGVVVRGFASDPEITFESTPALPEGEVLPRVLFAKSQQSLTSSEALDLAIGVATLLDGSGGPLDRLRAATGLDVLSIDTDDEDVGVTVGRNIADGVFVGARQPVGGGAASVTVEIEVFDNVTVDSEVSSESGSSVGLNWTKDF